MGIDSAYFICLLYRQSVSNEFVFATITFWDNSGMVWKVRRTELPHCFANPLRHCAMKGAFADKGSIVAYQTNRVFGI